MPRTFVVEVEGITAVAHFHQSPMAVEPGSMPLGACRFAGCDGLLIKRFRPVAAIGRFERLTAESIQQVHQHQFLMLLLMVKAQFHQVKPRCFGVALQKLFQSNIHSLAPG